VDMQPLLLFSSSPPVSHQQHQPLWPENLLYIVVMDHFHNLSPLNLRGRGAN